MKDQYLFAYKERVENWKDVVVLLRGAHDPEGVVNLVDGFGKPSLVLMALAESPGSMIDSATFLPSEGKGRIYLNQNFGPKSNNEAYKLVEKIRESARNLIQTVNERGGDSDLTRTYLKTLREVDKYTEWCESKLRKPEGSTLEEKFTWKGLKIEVSGYTEQEVRKTLDALSWVLDLFKRRGMSKTLYQGLREVIMTRDTLHITNERTQKEMAAAASYNPGRKQIVLREHSIKARITGRFLKNWLAEVFIHEFGHYIHLDVLPKEAKDFWDSGWDFVEKARKDLPHLFTISPEQSKSYAVQIEQAGWDPNAVGASLQGMERLRFVGYLLTREVMKSTKNIRLFPQVKKHLERAKDPMAAFEEDYPSGGYYTYPEEVLRKKREVYPQDRIEEARRIFGYDVKYPVYLTDEIVERIRKEDTSVDDALNALGIPSEYGKTNIKEDFAETFVEFMVHPERLDPIARWRMGRTLGMSKSLGTPIIKLTKIAQRALIRHLKYGVKS